jgi:hypothetical protein
MMNADYFSPINATGVERLRTLYAMMAGIPATKINLRIWRSDQENRKSNVHACGTTACAVGFATAFPDFVDQGLSWSINQGVPLFYGLIGFRAVESFFGVDCRDARALFNQGNSGDRHINAEDPVHPAGSQDKRRVLARIRNILLRNGSITEERCKELQVYEATLN